MLEKTHMPRHIAIVMDGNGRWAKKRLMPRILGHRAGVKAVRKSIDYCIDNRIGVLTLFALSVENFLSRPMSEVQFLISLLSDMLTKNIIELHEKNVRIRIIGDHSVFNATILQQIHHAEALTKNNTGLILVIALHYSGRWDILNAAKKFAAHAIENKIDLQAVTENDLAPFFCLHDLPEPDLFIRTSGEQRISNFLLWQLAYTELCFVDAFWPDFDENTFSNAIASFQKRERRFGLTGEQIASQNE